MMTTEYCSLSTKTTVVYYGTVQHDQEQEQEQEVTTYYSTSCTMCATRPALATAAHVTTIAFAIAFGEIDSRSLYPAFIAHNRSVSLRGKTFSLGRCHDRPLLGRRPQPRAVWVEETVSLEIPAPREAAYNVYTDLVRQPEWSPWLKSIEYDREKQTSKWVVQQNGIRISWSAVSTLEVPGVEVQWMSTTGLKNKGRVTFEDTGPVRCLMTLTLSYDLPFVLAKVLRLEVVERIVQRTLLSDLERFTDVLSRQPEVIAATTAVKEGATATEHDDSEGGSYGKLEERSGSVRVVEGDSFDEMPATPLTNIRDRTVDHVESGGSDKNLRNSISNINEGEGPGGQRGFWRKRLRRLRRVFRREHGMVTPSATASPGENVDCGGEGRDDDVR